MNRAIIARKRVFSGRFGESRKYSRNRCAKGHAAILGTRIAQNGEKRDGTALISAEGCLFSAITLLNAPRRRHYRWAAAFSINSTIITTVGPVTTVTTVGAVNTIATAPTITNGTMALSAASAQNINARAAAIAATARSNSAEAVS